MLKKFSSLVIVNLAIALAVYAPLASAHVIVTPKSALAAEEITFTISVPNEKDQAMTTFKLAVPSGVDAVVPTVQAGWTITADTSNDHVSDIVWQGGEIPAGQRADFSFSAQTPKKAGEIDWKAYQTYADGTVVSWDQKPVANATDDDTANNGPYSITSVTDSAPAADATKNSGSTATWALAVSLLALILSVLTLIKRGNGASAAGKS